MKKKKDDPICGAKKKHATNEEDMEDAKMELAKKEIWKNLN
jgi:hypothetical protein